MNCNSEIHDTLDELNYMSYNVASDVTVYRRHVSFRRRILIVDRINYIHSSLLIEIDDIIVNRVYLIPNTC